MNIPVNFLWAIGIKKKYLSATNRLFSLNIYFGRVNLSKVIGYELMIFSGMILGIFR